MLSLILLIFENLLNHSIYVTRMTCDSVINKLFVLKSRELSGNLNVTWNDQYIVKTVNRLSIFREHIVAYKASANVILQRQNITSYFIDMQHISKEITFDFIKAIYYTEGTEGIARVQNNLLNALDAQRFKPHTLKVYNLVLYSAPFILCQIAAQDPTIPDTDFFHTPFEVVISGLENTIRNFTYHNPIRTQLKFENSLPDVAYIRYIYDYFKSSIYSRTGKITLFILYNVLLRALASTTISTLFSIVSSESVTTTDIVSRDFNSNLSTLLINEELE